MYSHSDDPLGDLLATCRAKRLIDGFEREGDAVVLHLGYARQRLDGPSAMRFLHGLLQYESDLDYIDALFAFAAWPHPGARDVRGLALRPARPYAA